MLQKWTINSLSEELGRDRRTLKKILAGVAPADRDGQSDLYLLKDVFAALLEYYGAGGQGGGLLAEQERLTRAKADIAEIDRDLKRKTVASTEYVLRVLQNTGISVRRVIETSNLSKSEKEGIFRDLEGMNIEAIIEAGELEEIPKTGE